MIDNLLAAPTKIGEEYFSETILPNGITVSIRFCPKGEFEIGETVDGELVEIHTSYYKQEIEKILQGIIEKPSVKNLS